MPSYGYETFGQYGIYPVKGPLWLSTSPLMSASRSVQWAGIWVSGASVLSMSGPRPSVPRPAIPKTPNKIASTFCHPSQEQQFPHHQSIPYLSVLEAPRRSCLSTWTSAGTSRLEPTTFTGGQLEAVPDLTICIAAWRVQSRKHATGRTRMRLGAVHGTQPAHFFSLSLIVYGAPSGPLETTTTGAPTTTGSTTCGGTPTSGGTTPSGDIPRK